MAHKHQDGVIRKANVPMITLKTPLGQVPRWWLRYIEPKVIRGSFAPCWVWKGKMATFNKGTTKETAYPVMVVPVNLFDERGAKKQVYVHRWIAQMLWEFPEDYVVYRNCPNGVIQNCVNPSHFVISHRSDREYYN